MISEKDISLRLPALVTLDLAIVMQAVNSDHREFEQLAAEISRHCPDALRRVHCQSCKLRDQTACRNKTLDYLEQLLQFSWTHAASEMQLMHRFFTQKECNEKFSSHMDDHEAFSKSLSELAKHYDPIAPFSTLAHLVRLMQSWLNGHTAEHDDHLLALISQRMDKQDGESA